MASRIEGYAFVGNLHGAALVSRGASVEWLCVPRFDSDACMAALLGRDENGCWAIQPAAAVRRIVRRYRPGTLVLETEFHCDGGAVKVTDFMPMHCDAHALVRLVEGIEGRVPMVLRLAVRFGYGRYEPWIDKAADGQPGYELTVPPDALVLRTTCAVSVEGHDLRASFDVEKGNLLSFELGWHSAYESPSPPIDAVDELRRSESLWREWIGRSRYRGPYKDAVDESLVALRGMVYAPSGAIVAAPTAGLPEAIGGKRNWDYRYCWLRDATLTLDSLMVAGFRDEAAAFRRWLYQTIAGAPEDLQIMYGVLGERRLQEFEVPWLVGYDESRPVRIGNAASGQFQLDVYGEVVQAMYEARRLGVPEGRFERGPELELLRFLEGAWQRPDQGIWEMRGHAQHFVHSKVMAWAAFDRAARLYEEFSQPSDPVRSHVPRFRALAERIRREVCEQGFDGRRNAFVQAYGSRALDASSLLIPALGFLPARDPRVLGTIEAIERELVRDGLVLRYRTDGTSPARPEHRRSQDKTDDGLPGSEGAFLACSFWLADAYAYAGRRKEAEALFERLLGLRSEVGLLSEEYDPEAERLVGNYPQALSHLALVHTASLLADAEQTPRARERSERAAALHTATSHPSEHRH